MEARSATRRRRLGQPRGAANGERRTANSEQRTVNSDQRTPARRGWGGFRGSANYRIAKGDMTRRSRSADCCSSNKGERPDARASEGRAACRCSSWKRQGQTKTRNPLDLRDSPNPRSALFFSEVRGGCGARTRALGPRVPWSRGLGRSQGKGVSGIAVRSGPERGPARRCKGSLQALPNSAATVIFLVTESALSASIQSLSSGTVTRLALRSQDRDAGGQCTKSRQL